MKDIWFFGFSAMLSFLIGVVVGFLGHRDAVIYDCIKSGSFYADRVVYECKAKNA